MVLPTCDELVIGPLKLLRRAPPRGFRVIVLLYVHQVKYSGVCTHFLEWPHQVPKIGWVKIIKN